MTKYLSIPFIFILLVLLMLPNDARADIVAAELDHLESSINKCRQQLGQAADPGFSIGDVCVSKLFSEDVAGQKKSNVHWKQTSYYGDDQIANDDPRFNTVTKELDVVEGYIREQNDYVRPEPVHTQRDEVQSLTQALDEAIPPKKKGELNPPMVDFDKSRDEDIVRRAEARKFDSEYSRDTNRSKISVEIGPELSYFKYKEPGLMKEEGLYYGLSGSLTSRFPPYTDNEDLFNQPTSRTGTTMVRLEGNISWGEVDYKSEGTGELENIDDRLFEIRGLGGFDYETSDWAVFTPYFGVGYRYLNDDSGGKITTTGHRGYERESNYYYSPVGAELNMELGSGWSLGLTSEYDIFWFGKQKSHLGDAVAGLGTLSNEQKEGWGYRGSLRLQHTGENVDVLFEPFYRYWEIEDSDISNVTFNGVVVGYGLEPENFSKQFGLKTALKF